MHVNTYGLAKNSTFYYVSDRLEQIFGWMSRELVCRGLHSCSQIKTLSDWKGP